MDTYRVGALFTHSKYWWSPMCSLGVSLILSCLSNVFGGGFEVVWLIWCLFPLNLILRIRPDFFSSLPRVYGLPSGFGHYCMAAFLWDRIGPLVPLWYIGLWSFQRDCLVIASDVPGSLFYNYWSCSLLMKVVLWVYITFSPTWFIYTEIFTLVI